MTTTIMPVLPAPSRAEPRRGTSASTGDDFTRALDDAVRRDRPKKAPAVRGVERTPAVPGAEKAPAVPGAEKSPSVPGTTADPDLSANWPEASPTAGVLGTAVPASDADGAGPAAPAAVVAPQDVHAVAVRLGEAAAGGAVDARPAGDGSTGTPAGTPGDVTHPAPTGSSTGTLPEDAPGAAPPGAVSRVATGSVDRTAPVVALAGATGPTGATGATGAVGAMAGTTVPDAVVPGGDVPVPAAPTAVVPVPTSATAAAVAPLVPVDATTAPTPASPASPAAQAGAVPLTEQLVGRLASLRTAGAGGHVLTLHVDPESFGPVRVVAHIGVDGVRIELVGATDGARDALRAALPDLRRDLAATGLTADLDLGHGAPGRGADRDGRGDRPTGTRARDGAVGGPPSPADPTPRPAGPGLDLIL